jgi:hypothetical protein
MIHTEIAPIGTVVGNERGKEEEAQAQDAGE